VQCPKLEELPAPPSGKTGFPWTVGSPALPGSPTEWPRITLVTPSFNQGAFIEETIRSVLLQGYPNLEYMVIDGGSSDDTIAIIKKYARWLTHWVSEPDHGQAHAINKGLERGSGVLMNWLNSDDCLLSSALGYIGAYFQTHPHTDIVCGFRRNVVGNQLTRRGRVHLRVDRYTLSRICYIAQETTFWRRRVWDTVGALDESFRFAMDYDLWQRMLAAGFEFHLIPRFTGIFRMHPASKGARWLDVRYAELGRIYQKYLHNTKNERELPVEISAGWWRRTVVLRRLGFLGLLNHPSLARRIVNSLSLEDRAIPSKTSAPPRFINYWTTFQ